MLMGKITRQEVTQMYVSSFISPFLWLDDLPSPRRRPTRPWPPCRGSGRDGTVKNVKENGLHNFRGTARRGRKFAKYTFFGPFSSFLYLNYLYGQLSRPIQPLASITNLGKRETTTTEVRKKPSLQSSRDNNTTGSQS